jgi:phosphoglycolate phosphatase
MRLVLFDCDGTLVDSQAMIVASMTGAFAALGRVPPRREAVLSIVGLSLPIAIARLVPGDDAETVDRLVDAYKAAFQSLRASAGSLEPMFPGALDALDELARADDVLLGVVTGKSRRGLDLVLAHHGLADRFVVLRTADDGPSKPHPFMVLDAIAATGADVSRTVVVGDTTFDIEMAGAAGCRSIGVGWGYHPVEALVAAGADRLVDRFEDVPATVEAILPA